MSKYEITENKLFQDGVDISDTSVIDLKEAGETLLRFAKFKEAVEKAAVQCFGEPKKRGTRKPKANPTPDTTAPAGPAGEGNAATTEGATVTTDDGSVVDTTTGEVF